MRDSRIELYRCLLTWGIVFLSLVTIMITIGAFVLIRHVRISDRVGKVILWVAPSMFSVFLVHNTSWCLESLKGWVDQLVFAGIPLHLSFVVVASAVFVIGFNLDLPRRWIVRLWK